MVRTLVKERKREDGWSMLSAGSKVHHNRKHSEYNAKAKTPCQPRTRLVLLVAPRKDGTLEHQSWCDPALDDSFAQLGGHGEAAVGRVLDRAAELEPRVERVPNRGEVRRSSNAAADKQ